MRSGHSLHGRGRAGTETSQPRRVLLPCAFAITVSTALVTAVALFNVDEVSSSALALDAFRLGASALFLAAGLLRLARWRVTTDPHSALLAAAMLCSASSRLPLGNLVGPGACTTAWSRPWRWPDAPSAPSPVSRSRCGR